MIGQTVPRDTSAAFVGFLGEILASQPTGREIHVIADYLSTHKTQAEIGRDLLARGIFTSVPDLARKIQRYIRHYNRAARPIRWSYRNPAHRFSSTSASTVH